MYRQRTARRFGMNYMNGELAMRVLPNLIECIEKVKTSQEEINLCYESLTNLIIKEANSSVNFLPRK